jgi:hypothetical protein
MPPDEDDVVTPEVDAPGSGGAAGGRRERERDNDGGLSDLVRARLEAMVPEIVKRTFAAGMGLAKDAKDLTVPDVTGYIASSADATKDKVIDAIGRETREFLERMNLADEIAKLLTTLSFEIKTEIRFIPNSERFGNVEPDVKSAVRLKRDTKGGDKPERDE